MEIGAPLIEFCILLYYVGAIILYHEEPYVIRPNVSPITCRKLPLARSRTSGSMKNFCQCREQGHHAVNLWCNLLLGYQICTKFAILHRQGIFKLLWQYRVLCAENSVLVQQTATNPP